MARNRRDRAEERGESFSFADVLKWTDARRSNLIHWTNTGIIKADVEDTAGRGYPRRFSRLNMVEVQLGAEVNRLSRRFRVPVSLIGQAIRAFRDHHELCEAIWSAPPGLSVPDQELLSREQREAVERAYVRQALRRDEIGGAKGARSAAFYARDLRKKPDIFLESHQKLLLRHARKWRQFTQSPYGSGVSYVVLLFPEDQTATVEEGPLDIGALVGHVAIVVKLAPVLHYMRAVAGRML